MVIPHRSIIIPYYSNICLNQNYWRADPKWGTQTLWQSNLGVWETAMIFDLNIWVADKNYKFNAMHKLGPSPIGYEGFVQPRKGQGEAKLN